ncbi:hypothetical protein [Pedobacter nutrimenti]|uniref:Iron-sulfur cluster repair protein YtfE (RIC family) n=1 Tax=Pedobacter nutrimenti TaxID=1241337 RepID=A0A318UM93_9SPHI|nr:hypothetical protein [Pedobacter nutrimenti]PYF70598.1 iron-sulfur cluster repair protein YtfE (RIC family) [Pedobacter nutrimenti]
MITDYKITIGNMIVKDFRTAPLFWACQIDLATEQNKTIEKVCKEKDINLTHLMNDLNDIVNGTRESSSDYTLWPLGWLIDMISIRIRFIEENLSVILQFLDGLSEYHKKQDQCISDFCSNFNFYAGRLVGSLQRRILSLVSFIKQISGTQGEEDCFDNSTIIAVNNTVKKMIDEFSLHKRGFFSVIDSIKKYVPPIDAYNCFKTTVDLLTEFENDLNKIVSLQDIVYTRFTALKNELIAEHL